MRSPLLGFQVRASLQTPWAQCSPQWFRGLWARLILFWGRWVARQRAELLRLLPRSRAARRSSMASSKGGREPFLHCQGPHRVVPWRLVRHLGLLWISLGRRFRRSPRKFLLSYRIKNRLRNSLLRLESKPVKRLMRQSKPTRLSRRSGDRSRSLWI